MKKLLNTTSISVLFFAPIAAFFIFQFAPQARPVEIGPSKVDVKLNPTSSEKKKADGSYTVRNKIIVKKSKEPGGNLKDPIEASGTTTLTTDTGEVIGQEIITPEVTETENGELVINYDVPFAVKETKEDNRWSFIVAHEGDIGVAYEVGRLRSPFGMAIDLGIDGDIFLTQRRIGAGVSKRLKYGYIGLGESFDFKEGELDPVVYAGVKVNF